MTIIIAALGVGAALLLCNPTRALGAIALLLVAYLFPTADLVLAGMVLVVLVAIHVC